ncbi:DUF3040 domain-containing protein [Streptomyces aurantiogriseus]|uniref:DUF3040 domain-containing protein n=1 Tax=Streptomyces aurantiogriseus TaxID=66870 RepID=A0A918FDQ4_9ACTN|nr:DUF3040 domain-containing protein [Streptomyces aurantiogriseus]GGR25780.1 hypothetical protein GCM10010251_47290 [Streptomyces aurantiogriseus]
MTTDRLSDDERRILAEMERALRRDRRLDRRLRTLRWHPSLSGVASWAPRPWTVALLLAVSVGLTVAGIITSAPVVIWAFAAVWPPTLYAAFRLLCRWTEP